MGYLTNDQEPETKEPFFGGKESWKRGEAWLVTDEHMQNSFLMGRLLERVRVRTWSKCRGAAGIRGRAVREDLEELCQMNIGHDLQPSWVSVCRLRSGAYSSSSGSHDYVMWPKSEMPKIPRATMHWDGNQLEMQENGSTSSLTDIHREGGRTVRRVKVMYCIGRNCR